MKANIIDISLPIPYLGKFWFSSYGEKCSSNQIAGFFKMLYLKKEVNDKFIFGMQINIELFYKLILKRLLFSRFFLFSQKSRKC